MRSTHFQGVAEAETSAGMAERLEKRDSCSKDALTINTQAQEEAGSNQICADAGITGGGVTLLKAKPIVKIKVSISSSSARFRRDASNSV
jgi:hypothetical protein